MQKMVNPIYMMKLRSRNHHLEASSVLIRLRGDTHLDSNSGMGKFLQTSVFCFCFCFFHLQSKNGDSYSLAVRYYRQMAEHRLWPMLHKGYAILPIFITQGQRQAWLVSASFQAHVLSTLPLCLPHAWLITQKDRWFALWKQRAQQGFG